MMNINDCWLFAGYKEHQGYGQIFTYKKGKASYQYAHRVSYETFVGEIPEGLVIDHLCRVRCCINPDHLEPVTPSVNTLRGQSLSTYNAKKTHCPKGHEYNESNTMYSTKGWRICKQCRIIQNRLAYKRSHATDGTLITNRSPEILMTTQNTAILIGAFILSVITLLLLIVALIFIIKY